MAFPEFVFLIIIGDKMNDYDYMREAWRSRGKARCLSRQLGTCIVTTSGTIIIGYNGTPVDVPTCEERYGKCPRENSKSGEDLHLCPAIHAEVKPILTASRKMIGVEGGTLYCSFGIPCKDCMKSIMGAGISTIVVTRMTYYDELSKQLLKDFENSGGHFKVLDVAYCPDCNSLNVSEDKSEHDGNVEDGDVRRNCDDCGNYFDICEKRVYVGVIVAEESRLKCGECLKFELDEMVEHIQIVGRGKCNIRGTWVYINGGCAFEPPKEEFRITKVIKDDKT